MYAQMCVLNVVLCTARLYLTNLDTRLLSTVHKNALVSVNELGPEGTIDVGVVCRYRVFV